MSELLAGARSFLFVPGSRPERFAKALGSGADCVILDLEDAVAPQEKAVARQTVAQSLAAMEPSQRARTLVRINPAGTAWHAGDLDMVREGVLLGLGGVMFPKAESADALGEVAAALGAAAKVVPLIESLAGYDALRVLADVPQVVRLAFGHLDFQLDLGMRCSLDEGELTPVRLALVAASRRARLAAPIDGVTTDARNADRTSVDARRAGAFGFTGKLCIHPDQVRPVNDAFTPLPDEVEWARRVVDAAHEHHGEAFSLEGRMVDLPVVRLAERTLQRRPAQDAPI